MRKDKSNIFKALRSLRLCEKNFEYYFHNYLDVLYESLTLFNYHPLVLIYQFKYPFICENTRVFYSFFGKIIKKCVEMIIKYAGIIQLLLQKKYSVAGFHSFSDVSYTS